jgi:hypothetical protein
MHASSARVRLRLVVGSSAKDRLSEDACVRASTHYDADVQGNAGALIHQPQHYYRTSRFNEADNSNDTHERMMSRCLVSSVQPGPRARNGRVLKLGEMKETSQCLENVAYDPNK